VRRDEADLLKKLYELLDEGTGWEDWWPADSGFERVAGAILIQRTRWKNVDRALAALKAEGLLAPGALASCPPGRLEGLIRPAGFYRQKAARLKAVAKYFATADIGAAPTEKLRHELLELPGVGLETADVILLYVAGRPRFVVDAYAWHMLSCLGCDIDYETLQLTAKKAFSDDLEAYRRLHARIVEHGKCHCNKKACGTCGVKKYLG
jgi:endonuclease-3 related protein